eukprot:Skav217661  [mRNA]  locus=scaffold2919:128154:130839:+ [translate_table: standard]
MFQLHLQFIHLPLFPFHYNLFQSGEHFTRGRFFPLEYMKQALALGDAVRIDDAGSCDIESLISKVKAAGGGLRSDLRCDGAQNPCIAKEAMDLAGGGLSLPSGGWPSF